MRVVLDTNIFISGIFWKGKCRMILDSWKEEKFVLITSSELISELIKVLNDFKIQMPKSMIKHWIKLIINNSEIVEINERVDIVKSDPKDNMVVETAITGKSDYIITQDNDLLRIKQFRNIKILTPEDFILPLQGI